MQKFEFRSNQIFNLAILTISDTGSKGERVDTSGDAISMMMKDATGFEEVAREIVADEVELISAKLIEWCDTGDIDLVVTTGGTGLGPRDVTPEATRQVIDLEVPGMAEAMRMETIKITPFAMLSRSVVGVRNGCLIVNLPGSPKGVQETLEVALRGISHALEMVKGWRTH
jgi:molybdenum cofactor synthesis domain-containing protein